jgi:hypothetical protein
MYNYTQMLILHSTLQCIRLGLDGGVHWGGGLLLLRTPAVGTSREALPGSSSGTFHIASWIRPFISCRIRIRPFIACRTLFPVFRPLISCRVRIRPFIRIVPDIVSTTHFTPDPYLTIHSILDPDPTIHFMLNPYLIIHSVPDTVLTFHFMSGPF